MKLWDKKEIEVAGGAKVLAQMPIVVSKFILMRRTYL